jgi:hypothetical protein
MDEEDPYADLIHKGNSLIHPGIVPAVGLGFISQNKT